MLKIILSFQILLLVFWANTFESPYQAKNEMTMCFQNAENINSKFSNYKSLENSIEIPFKNDPSMSYSMPYFTKDNSGSLLITWTEKDESGLINFCLAKSADQGKTWSDKNIIFSSKGIGNSRMMRAKLLCKKNGDLVAVFTNRTETNASQGKGGRSSSLVYVVSTDQGKNWSSPKNIDNDPTVGIVRGFFDAVVLSNDEMAVVYLKDVANSKKHEERDLRIAITKNGVFQDEKLIDPVVCDCCPINLTIDSKGYLNVFYRDNIDDIRDMSKMVSKDNGATFSSPQNIYADNWKISGCPHNGLASTNTKNGILTTWFSGADKDPGFRLLNADGKRLFNVSDASAKNALLFSDAEASFMIWEQKDQNALNRIALKKINGTKLSENYWIDDKSFNATNAFGIASSSGVLVAREIQDGTSKNKIVINQIKL